MSEDGMEQKYVKEAFDTNWVVPLGPNVNGFEKDLEEFVNGPSTGGPSTSSGTAPSVGKRVVALSAGPYVSDEDVCYIVETIKANIIG